MNSEYRNNPLLEDLNQEQKVAVLQNESHLRIIAGAGSGKTKVLTRKIPYLVEYMNVDPQSILAITFTNKAVVNMKKRLWRHLEPAKRNVRVDTFYTLCANILRGDSKLIGIKNTFQIIDEKDSDEILKRILEDLKIPKTDFDLSFIRRSITHKKLDDFFDSRLLEGIELTEEELEKIDLIFNEYEARRKSHNQLDMEDLLTQTHRLLVQYPVIAMKWQRQFKYILVDEFQDINIIQYHILKVIANNAIVTVVGDPDQTIYSWLGADVRLFLNFDEDFEGARTVMLSQNYRSSQKILTLANNLISHNKLRFDKNLYTENEDGSDVEFNLAFNADAEARWIVSKINQLKKMKIQLKNIAILYRSNYLMRSLEQQLIVENINHIVYGGVKFYEHPNIKQIMWFLQAIHNWDTIALENVINLPVQRISDKNLDLLKKQINYSERKYLYKYIISNFSKLPWTAKEKNAIKEFFVYVNNYNKAFKNPNETPNISYLLDLFLKDIKYYKFLEKHTQDEDGALEIIKELMVAIDKWQEQNPKGRLGDWFEYISLFSENEEINKGNNYISLMTVHNSKGLEFENVFLMGLSEDIFPSFQRTRDDDGKEDTDKIEEERRLAYVAITRTKKRLFISDARGINVATSKQRTPSRFIEEMGIKLSDHVMDIDSLNTDLNDGKSEHHWVVGDYVTHRHFGEGEIVDIINNEDILVVFQKYGPKAIKKTHDAIRIIPREK